MLILPDPDGGWRLSGFVMRRVGAIQGKGSSWRGASVVGPSAFLHSLALAWLCCIAIVVQCIVVQSHVHLTTAEAANDIAFVALDGALQDKSTDKSKPSAPASQSCFLCQQAAMTGLSLPPVSPAPTVIQRVEEAQPPAIELALVLTQVSHSWRSRGPPLSAWV
jgi:Protein of unknown function (DUF2946)